MMNLPNQKREALGEKAVMKEVSRLEIANKVGVKRTFVRCT